MSETYICRAERTNVLLAPKTSSSLETQLIYGQGFIGHKSHGAFIEGELLPLIENAKLPRSKGFVRAKDLAPLTNEPDYKISALKAPVFARKDIKSPIKMLLPFGARVQALSSHRSFIRIGRGQYIHRQHIASMNDYATDFVEVAERHMGLPYIWGGVSSEGLDCSGLVQAALWAAGTSCPRNSGEQKDLLGTAIDTDAPLKRGDLIFWPGHVGIMQDSARMIHANGFHMRTESEPLTIAAGRIEKSDGPIIAIKRL